MKPQLHIPDLPELPVTLSPLQPPPDDQQRRQRLGWAVRLREGIVGYVPLMLMVGLALGTWLVAKNTPGLLASSGAVAVRHEPDYTLDQFDLQRFDASGALKVQIQGEHMQHFPDDDVMEVEQIRVVTTEEDGSRTTATSQHGRARGDGSEVWLDGQAQVVSESASQPPLQINGEHLHALPKLRRVDSRHRVTVRQDGSEFDAQGLEYDDATRLLTLHGDVHALMQPALRKAVSSRAGQR